MIAKTKNAVAALTAFANGAFSGPSTTALIHAGPGYHAALSHRRRLRVLQQRQPGVRYYLSPRLN
jgi:hypothetical protein